MTDTSGAARTLSRMGPGGWDVASLARVTGHSEATIRAHMRVLLERGAVVIVGRTRHGGKVYGKP